MIDNLLLELRRQEIENLLGPLTKCESCTYGEQCMVYLVAGHVKNPAFDLVSAHKWEANEHNIPLIVASNGSFVLRDHLNDL